MANREALRELQVRLAGRLQAARVEGLSVSSWLAVESAGQSYLLPLAQSGEIFPWVAVQPVPYTQAWFLGVANLRGGLVGVVDLAGLLGSSVQRTEQMLSESSLLAFNAVLDVNAALLVDRLAGLRGTDAFVSAMIAVLPSRPKAVAIVMGRATEGHGGFLDGLKAEVAAAGKDEDATA